MHGEEARVWMVGRLLANVGNGLLIKIRAASFTPPSQSKQVQQAVRRYVRVASIISTLNIFMEPIVINAAQEPAASKQP